MLMRKLQVEENESLESFESFESFERVEVWKEKAEEVEAVDFEFFIDDVEKKEDEGSFIVEDYENLDKYFPFPEMRPGQPEVLAAIKQALLDPKIRIIIAELPTGWGKSPMALAAAKASGLAYIATANKFLQKQYLRDFSDLLVELKGKANYKCTQYDVPEILLSKFGEFYNCVNSPCQETKKSREECSQNRCCEYHKQFDLAVEADITLFNYASALAFLNHTDKFQKRNLLICDECHNIPHWITSFVSVDFTQKSLQDIGFTKKIPSYNTVDEYSSFLVEVQRCIKNKLKVSSYLSSDLVDKLETLSRRFTLFDKVTLNKMNMNNFVLEKQYENDAIKSSIKSLSFKPIDVSKLVNQYLFKHGKKIILFSATVLDFETYKEMIGIDNDEECAIIQAANRFPKENRPILTNMMVGWINRNNLPDMLPKIVESISLIMNHHPNVKGLIHGVTYNICDYIYQNLKSDRLLYPREARYQYDMYQEHITSSKSTFLLSPSMTEGVDLYDDLCRVQIYAKMPYISLGAPVVSKRKDKYPNYYNMQTALSLVQGMGRGIRNEKDFCYIYMLDKCFFSFFENNFDILPDDFEEIIDVYKRGRKQIERKIKPSNRQYIHI